MMESRVEARPENAGQSSQRDITTCVSIKRFSAGRQDTPVKFKENAELSIPDVEVFYSNGIKGYTDYPFLEKSLGF